MEEQKQRRGYTPEFKAQMVQLVLSSQKSMAQTCREYDLPETTVQRWVKQAEIDDGKLVGLTTAEREELTRLRRQNRDLLEERTILKKAVAFFARETR